MIEIIFKNRKIGLAKAKGYLFLKPYISISAVHEAKSRVAKMTDVINEWVLKSKRFNSPEAVQ